MKKKLSCKLECHYCKQKLQGYYICYTDHRGPCKEEKLFCIPGHLLYWLLDDGGFTEKSIVDFMQGGNKIKRVSDGGNLLVNLALLEDISTWQTSQEVFGDWQSGAPVEGVNTANLAVYRIVDNEVVFDLLGRESNPFCDERFQEEAYNGILNNDFFLPQGAMKEYILAAMQPDATIRYSGLRIKTKNCDEMYGYVEVEEKNTGEEKKLFELVYSTTNPGKGRRVYLLRENVVKAQLQGNKNAMIARACFFNNDENFFALDWGISNYDCAVRGVLKKQSEKIIK